MRKWFLVCAALSVLLGASLAAFAQPSDNGSSPGPDPNGYYSQSDQEGYYDRNGNYIRYDNQDQNGTAQSDEDNGPPPEGTDSGPPPQGYDNGPPPQYREGYYEDNCRRGNAAAGTIFGAIAGGLIGGAIGHHPGPGPHGGTDAGAVIGGAILGGMFGNSIARDIPCEDHRYAFSVYAEGLNGNLGQRYDWQNPATDDYGYFVPEREFKRDGYVCRSFSETTFHHGRKYTRPGTACRMRDGNWRFD